MKYKRPSVLFLLQTPPPVHGSSIVGAWIQGSPVVNSALGCRFINTMTSQAVGEIGRGGLRKLGRYVRLLGGVVRETARRRFDLCYYAMTAKGVAFYKDAVVIAIIRLFRLPLVIHLHSKGVGTRSGRWFDDLLYRMVFRGASVILLSPRLYVDVQRYVPAHRVRYCPNGIPAAEAGFGRTPHARVPEILFLSNMLEEKGVYVLLEACRMLKAEQIVFRCRFVGAWNDVSESEFDRRIRAYGLTDCVTHRGGAYGDEKEACFADADIFAFPSFYHNEALPLVVIEAMKHSLPVVSTVEGGIADLVEDGVSGLLCPQRDVPALAAALRALLVDESLRLRMGRAGRERFEREFTLERFELRLTSILTELAGDVDSATAPEGSAIELHGPH